MDTTLCVNVDDDPCRSRGLGGEKDVEDELIEGSVSKQILLVAPITARGRKLQSVQRIPTRQRLALVPLDSTVISQRVELADDARQEWVDAKSVMVNQVFVTENDAEDTPADQLARSVLEPCRVPLIVKALRRPLEDSGVPLQLLQQEQATIT